MSSCVQRLVKFVPFIMHLNEFPLDNSCCEVMNNIAFHEKGFFKKYLCLLREGLYVRQICVFHEKGFDIRSWCLLVLEVYAFHEKDFYKKDGKEY